MVLPPAAENGAHCRLLLPPPIVALSAMTMPVIVLVVMMMAFVVPCGSVVSVPEV